MFRRVNVQPDPMKDYILECENGKAYYGRWVCGNSTYEGWYLPEVRMIFPQKILKVITYAEVNGAKRTYFPKSFLDDVFGNRSEIPFFTQSLDNAV